MLKFIGSLLLTPGTPILLSTAFPTFAGQQFNDIVIAQRRGNTTFIFVGDQSMTGEANASFSIPPTSASSCPFANVEMVTTGRSNPWFLRHIKVDGNVAETIQISGLIY